MVAAGGLSLMVTWWASPLDKVSQNRFSPSNFALHGFVPAGYAVFAFALGATAGLLIRRTLPAMVVTLVGFIAVRLAVTFWVRPHYMSPVTTTLPLSSTGGGFSYTGPAGSAGVASVVPTTPNIPNAWVTGTSIVDKAGRAPTSAYIKQACPSLISGGRAGQRHQERHGWRRDLREAHRRGPHGTRPSGVLPPMLRHPEREVPRGRHLPTGQPVLDVPDDGDRALRAARPGGHRRVRLVGPAPHQLTTARRDAKTHPAHPAHPGTLEPGASVPKPESRGANRPHERAFHNADPPDGRCHRFGRRGVHGPHYRDGQRGHANGPRCHVGVNLSRPLIPVNGGEKPMVGPNGIDVTYSSNWSGYAALPKTAGDTFTSIVGNYNVPSVVCSTTPNTFSYHWIGLDGWADQTVEQDGIAADCNGTTAQYAAWFEMYPDNFEYSFAVDPGDAIESAVHYLGNAKYELSLKDVTSGQGFDVAPDLSRLRL